MLIKQAPSLHVARYVPNTCVLGKSHLYVFGGFGKLAPLNTIEVLNAAAVIADPENPTNQWELIEPKTGPVPGPRTNAIFTPISSTEIVIIGGFCSDYKTDSYIFDTEA